MYLISKTVLNTKLQKLLKNNSEEKIRLHLKYFKNEQVLGLSFCLKFLLGFFFSPFFPLISISLIKNYTIKFKAEEDNILSWLGFF